MTLDQIAAFLKLEGCPLSPKQYAALVDLEMKGSKFGLIEKEEKRRRMKQAIEKSQLEATKKSNGNAL